MSIARAIMTDDPAEREAYINYEVLRAAVSYQIFSPNGKILDVRRSVMFKATDAESGNSGTSVMTGDEWDAVKDAMLDAVEGVGFTYELIDGRDYTAKGTLRKVKTGGK